MTTPNTIVRLSEMILHDVALEQYPWLSAQILNRWKRQQVIRSFKGKDGKVAYPMSDLEMALTKELGWDESESQEGFSNTEASGSDRKPAAPVTIATGTPTRTEADELREKLSLQSIFGTPKKNSSKSLVARRNPPKPQQASA